MELVNLVFILLAKSAMISGSTMRFVDYTVVSSASTSHSRVHCAETFADNQYLAARINNITGLCEGLTWDWGSDPQYEAGFSYIRKTKTVDLYDPVVEIDSPFHWLIPGSFDVGGRLEFYMTMPKGTSWQGFEINVLDTSASSFQVNDSEPEVIMMHIHIQRASTALSFKTWVPNIWTDILYMALPFADGSTHKVTIEPLRDVMSVLFDEEEVVQYAHPTNPATAKQLMFSPYADTILQLNNITFIGV